MPDLQDNAIGRRIAEARQRRGITQMELAQSVSIDRSAVAKIESGSRRVSALELANIARELDQRIDWFVNPAPESIVSHRNLQDPGSPSPTIDARIEELSRNVEFLARHSQQLLDGQPSEYDTPHDDQSADAMAAYARKVLNLTPQSPILDLQCVVEAIGLLPFSFDLGNDSADAATILLESGGVTLINGDLKVGRRRLSLAHELGHYLIADDYTVDWRVSQNDRQGGVEARLDRFARTLLLPAEGVSDFWTSALGRGTVRSAALRTASTFRVDMSTLSRRLLELGLIAGSEASLVREVRTKKADIVELDLYVPHDLEPDYLPTRYQQAVLSLYRSETITAPRALEMLLGTFDEDGLPDLPPAQDWEIWQFTS